MSIEQRNEDQRRDPDHWLTPGVVGVGAASLCSDTSHELVTSLLPSFLTSTLHTGPAALGAVEGVSDALTGLSKLIGGPLATDPRRRGRLAAGGYAGTAVATAAIGLTTAVWQVGVLRALAWTSRGIRTPARDTLLTSLVAGNRYGRAIGVERAGDNAGAILGPLLAAGLVGLVGVRWAMLASIVPGLLAVLAIGTAAREARRSLAAQPAAGRTLSLQLGRLHRAGLTRLLLPIACFELGNVAATLLILRATGLLSADSGTATTATSLAIVLYAVHNALAAGTSLIAGRLCDWSPRVALVIGALAYTLGYLLFACGAGGWPVLLAAFVLSGSGIGFAETAQSSAVAYALPEHLRSNGFGVLGLVQAAGDLGSTVLAGLLWSVASATVAFGYAAAWMIACVLVCAFLWPARSAVRTHPPGRSPG